MAQQAPAQQQQPTYPAVPAQQPMMQQPGKPRNNMMIIAIIAIVAVVIVVLAIILMVGLGGPGASSLTIVGTPDDSNVNAVYWGLHAEKVSVDVTVKNNAAITQSGTINVKIVSVMPVLGTEYTSEGSKTVTLTAGAQQTFSVDVPMGATQAALLITSPEVTVTIT